MAKQGTLRFVENRKALGQIRTSPAVFAELERRAALIQAAAGGEELGFLTDRQVTKGKRARVSVRTSGFEAIRLEAHHRRLTKAFQAGRGW